MRLLGSLLLELGRRVHDWRAYGGASPRLIADYEDRSTTLGTEVRALLPSGADVRGTARAIDECGRLIIDSANGSVVVAAGDVVHVRA
jgi:BirA family biotin operon repressor/biotin-[acetyl-CoA-carboxylase] ligase